MKAKLYIDNATGDLLFRIKLTQLDLKTAKLDSWDRFLLDECDESEKISDKLLALEMLARKIEALD